ncbi:MAG: BatA domain-containing protein [Alphaproteobacteria bacterium]
MSFAAIGFIQPLILSALALLPLIWWLLRFTPPSPAEVAFPAVRLLLGLQANEETPARSPWWLTALRMLIAALIIVALASPVFNPQSGATAVSPNLLIVVDNGWASASRWPQRRAMLDAALQQADSHGQTVSIVATASLSAEEGQKAAGLEPQPFSPNRVNAARLLSTVNPGSGNGYDVVWLADGVDSSGAANLAAELTRLSAGYRFSIVTDTRGHGALGLGGQANTEKALQARIVSAEGGPRKGRVSALSGRGARLADAPFSLAKGKHETQVTINLPLELRNQVTRLEISGEPSAGATHLLDASTFWQRFGITSGEAREAAQPLLSPTHYIERALSPHGEVTVSSTGNIKRDTSALLERHPTILIYANIGRIISSTADRLKKWVRKGGVLVRFAGPRLEKGGDTLLPVPLRRGGRAMGGALSWQTPQALAPFEEQSPFYGLTIPEDVKITRQVLADPAATQHSKAQVWARLEDGTPLVTAARQGTGWLVLFHISANSDWSNLPMSGLFVQMLRRTAKFAHGTSGVAQDASSNGEQQTNDAANATKAAESRIWPYRTAACHRECASC